MKWNIISFLLFRMLHSFVLILQKNKCNQLQNRTFFKNLRKIEMSLQQNITKKWNNVLKSKSVCDCFIQSLIIYYVFGEYIEFFVFSIFNQSNHVKFIYIESFFGFHRKNVLFFFTNNFVWNFGINFPRNIQIYQREEKEEGKGKFTHKYMCVHEDRTKASFTVNLYLGYVNENRREKSVYFEHIHV